MSPARPSPFTRRRVAAPPLLPPPRFDDFFGAGSAGGRRGFFHEWERQRGRREQRASHDFYTDHPLITTLTEARQQRVARACHARVLLSPHRRTATRLLLSR